MKKKYHHKKRILIEGSKTVPVATLHDEVPKAPALYNRVVIVRVRKITIKY